MRVSGVGTGPTAAKLTVDKAGTEKQSKASPSGKRTLGKGRGAAAAGAAVAGAADETRNGAVQHTTSPQCRARSSGKLRGGDLM